MIPMKFVEPIDKLEHQIVKFEFGNLWMHLIEGVCS